MSTAEFLEVATDLGLSLVLLERRGGKELGIVSGSPAFWELACRQGFRRESSLVFEVARMTDDDDGASVDCLDWMAAKEGKRCLHVFLQVPETTNQEPGRQRSKKARTDAPRRVPMLLMESRLFTRSGESKFCASIVFGDQAYSRVGHQGLFLYFPLRNTEYLSDSFWEQLGYRRSSHPRYPEHDPASWTSLIDKQSLAKCIAHLGEVEDRGGATPYDVGVSYQKVSDETCTVYLRCQGVDILWSEDGKKIVALLGSHVDVSFENNERLSKISFIGKISHEIRTPLNAVCGSLEILDDYMVEAPSANLREAWDMLQVATRQVQTVVDDILDFSALSVGRLKLRKSSFSLEDVLGDVVKLHSYNASLKNISLITSKNGSSDFPPIFADRARLTQVFSNVLSNAVKFTPANGTVTVEMSRTQDEQHSFPALVSETNSSVQLTVDVTDTGVGVPRDNWELIFEDFEQARASDAIVGTGLGLAICSMIVGLHGGRIFIKDSKPHVATTVRVQLDAPLSDADHARDSKRRNTKQTSANKTTKQQTVGRALVVDDMQTNRVVLSNLIRKIDPEALVTLAVHGQEAVAICRDNIFDMIFMDVHMPVLDGTSFRF